MSGLQQIPCRLFAAVFLLGVASAAAGQFDRGAVSEDFALRGMTITLRRTPAQQIGLEQLLAEQQNPSSPNYHKWLTPEEFADRFGASSEDLARLRGWLESNGMQVRAVARGRTFIRFDATAKQVHSAFGTAIHHYLVHGVSHYGNDKPPSLPAALAPMVLAVGGMDDFVPHPHYAYSGGSLNALAPADLAAIYDIGGLQTPVPNGAGQTVVVIGSSDVSASDVQLYCTTFSADPACGTALTFASPGLDPGTDPDWANEETMDLELVSAVAPGAALVLDVDTSVWNALYDAIDGGLGQVILMSFGICEELAGSSLAASVEAAAQEANALGITLIASSGDSGGAGCDAGTATATGAHGPAVNLPASLPEVTGVGGTELTEGSGTYWSDGTATGYIPEQAWNDTNTSPNLAASGGGVSTLFSKPAWQSGTNVPADGQRDVPDIALAASATHDGYVIAIDGALSTAGVSPYAMGGTSAAAAVFAGMVALLNEPAGTGSGNINAALYTIAGGSSGAIAFHDITTGDNIVPCASQSNGCSSSPLQLGWSAGAGYDLATGLGSVDEGQLAQAWPAGYDTTPVIGTLLPSAAGAGSSTQTVGITGTGFTSLSSVTWTFNAQTTVLASSCTSTTACSATAPAALLATPGTASIRVLSASGLNSAASPFNIASAPTIASLSPNSADAGSDPFTLTVSGSNFVSGSIVWWGGTALTTVYGSATSLTASVTSTQLASAGAQSVTVRNATGVSTASTFTVNGPAITLLTPASAVSGSAPFTLTVTGSNFASGSTVMWGATQLTTTYVGATSLTAAVTSPQLATSGTQNVTVQDAYGVSAASVFTVSGPTITLLSPASAVSGSGPFALTVTGTNFINGSAVLWNSVPLATTFGGAASLTAQVTSTQLIASGPQNVTVQNPSAAFSTASTFTVYGPTIASLGPASAVAGSADFTLTVTGTNFISGSTAIWNSTPLATTYVNATSLTAAVTSAQLVSAGPQYVTVQNPSACSSPASTFAVNGPTIASLSPATTVAGGSSFPLTITGTNFINGSKAIWNATPLTTAYVSATSLTATVTGAQLAAAGPQSVTVQNSSGSSSSGSTFTVIGPTIASVSPSTIAAGSTTATTITVTGANFIPFIPDGSGNYAGGSLAYLGSTPLAVTAGTGTSITAAISASLVAATGKLSLTVHNPGGAISPAFTVTVVAPTITSLSSTSAVAGSAPFTLTVLGTNFVNGGSTVMWGSTALQTTYGSATSLTANVTSTQLASAGPQSITVQNSSSASSATNTFTVAGPAITYMNPTAAAAGTTIATTITLTGTNFIPVTLDGGGNYASGSLVYAGTTALPVTAGTATSITAAIPAGLVAGAGKLNLTVQNPGGAASPVSAFTVNGPTIASLSPASGVAGSGLFTLTITGANFVSGSTAMWNSTPLTTTYGSATSLTAGVASTQLLAAGSQNVTIRNSSAASSSASAFMVNGPTITLLSPAAIGAGDAQFTLTVTGVNFVSGSTVMWGTTPLSTVYGSATSLAATVATTQLASAGPQSVTVQNSSAAASSASTFMVDGPAIASLSPAAMAAGGSGFTLAVGGMNFVNGSTVMWNTTPLVTTYVSATSLTATVTSTQLTTAGSPKVTVKNSSAASSPASTFNVTGPTIASLSPTSIAAGTTTPATITVTGANFIPVTLDGSGNYVAGSLVYSGTTALAVTAGNATSITAAIPARLLGSTGKLSLTVHNPGGAASAASTVTVVGPTLTSLSPNSALAGGSPFTLSVTGTNFAGGSTVMWGATTLATTYGSATSLTASVTSAQLASAGSPKVTVKNSSTASSSAIAFTVGGPTITSLSPTSIAAGDSPFTLTVTGMNFVSGSRVMWGSTPLTTTYGSTTSLTAAVTSTQIAAAGSPKVTVQNSSGASSSASTFSVSGPTINSLNATSAAAGCLPFALTVAGTNFVAGSKVMWNSTALVTTFGSATSLTAAVTSAQLASIGPQRITVQNSSAASSPERTFNLTGPTITSLSPKSIAAGAAPFTLTIAGNNFVSGSRAMWGATPLTTTYGSTTSLTAAVTSAQVASAGSPKVTVQNSSAASSPASTFTVAGPSIASISPTSAVAGDTPFTLTVNGTNFVAGSKVMWNTTPLTTTFGDAGSLTAAVTSTQLASAGPQKITVQNSSAASSSVSTFTVMGPTIGSLSPTSTIAGSGPFTLTVTGTNFVNGSTVVWNSTTLITTYGSANSLSAAVTGTQIPTAGSAKVKVQNASGASSAAIAFTIKAH